MRSNLPCAANQQNGTKQSYRNSLIIDPLSVKVYVIPNLKSASLSELTSFGKVTKERLDNA